MSLQVWLPLNGNLLNKGIGEFSTSTTSITYSTNGKTGNQCLTSQISSISIPNMVGKKQMSFAYWVKIITATSTNWLDSFRWYSTDGTSDYSSRQEFYTNSTLTRIWFKADSSGINSVSGKTNVVGEWRHYVATLDYLTGDVKFYINGSLVGSRKSLNTSHYIKGTNFLLHENNLDHAINDFRLYDHILSAKEIKEISKGLILHYPLDNNGLGNPNLAINSNTNSTSTNVWNLSMKNGDKTTTIEQDDGINCVKITRGSVEQSGWAFLSYNNFDRQAIKTDTWYTVSFDIKTSVAGTITRFTGLVNSNATNYMTGSDRIIINNQTIANQWSHIIMSIKTISDFSNITIGSQVIYFSLSTSLLDTGVTLLLKNIKLEEGTIASPWIPNSEDELYDILGYNLNTIYDSSGYLNNGILTDLTYSTDTLKYNASANFDGNTSVISLGNISSLLQNLFTINLWFKKSELGSKNYETLFGGPSGFEMDTRAGGSTTLSLYMTSARGGNVFSSFNLNLWYMVTMVNDGTNELYYINGELKKTIAKKSMPSGNYFIGAWSTAIKQNYKGLISDFRIYSTVLNEGDILELYHTLALVDKNNNFYTYQYNLLGNNNEIEYFHSFRSRYTDAIAEMKEDGFHIEGYDWIDHGNGVFIPVNPTNKIYKFDIICSISAGNQFYIGWERYDLNKAIGTNAATIYAISPKPAEDLVYQRYQGTINLSANGLNNPCAFIKLRILNKWTGSTTDTEGKAIIHYLSLKEYDSNKTITPIKIEREGIVTTNSFIENSIGTSIDRSQVLHSNSFYEI